jgi:hypothetical protein
MIILEHNNLNNSTNTTKNNAQNDENDTDRGGEILKLKLMLKQKEEESLRLHLNMGFYGVKPDNFDADLKEYVQGKLAL